ncbi:hypothetical protein L2E82_10230 [Cichorium intybus]|uniref:Uncharacterized protein n=1 Tax=Cichorium intybus TaxID=13427 RepID=A0ACB9GB13_CICIN|nr:hypothetical protein L2E82_10230 [Cichorium intybus]
MDIFTTENLSFSPTAPSPRISFSHNLDDSLIESYPYRSNSSPDFHFCCTSDPVENESSSADELFCNGLIRPYYNEENILLDQTCDDLKHVPSATTDQICKQERSEEIVSGEGFDGNQSKSFWRIKRSSSFQCESTKQKSSFWSSLPLLSRSNSTGSVAKDRQNKHNSSQKLSNKSPSMAVVSNNNGYSSMKPPLKRNYGGGYDYGIRVGPVLNVPPPFISKSAANLLGLGSFFRHGSDHKPKK